MPAFRSLLLSFGLSAVSLLTPCDAAAAPQGLSTKKLRGPLFSAANDLARLGREDLVDEVFRILGDLGAPEDETAKWRRKATRSLERATGEPKARAVESCARRLDKAVTGLASSLEGLDQEAAARLAWLLLELDSTRPVAHEALGHEVWNGGYVAPEVVEFDKRAIAMEAAVADAMALELEVEISRPATSRVMREVYGDDSHSLSCHGVVVHGGVDAARLERALRQAVRGAAFTNWVMTGDLAVPKIPSPIHISFTANEPDYQQVLTAAEESKWADPVMLKRIRAMNLESFVLNDQERCSRWRMDSRISALVHWLIVGELYASMLPPFKSGHVNWVALRFFGTGKPSSVIKEESSEGERTATAARIPTEALWRAANSGMFGARSWIRFQLEKGKSMGFVRSLLDQEGMISGEPLLIATVVTEYLQINGRFGPAALHKAKGEITVLRATEAALGQAIPDLDEEWIPWLLGERPGQGVLQRLAPASQPPDDEVAKEAKLAVAYLAELREQAYEALGVFTEKVVPIPELCSQNALHAAYLNLNPDQKSAWPDAHEEYPEREGFSAAGAWGGAHSVIAFTGDARAAIDQWMGTFFHRLPLLEPGLCGTGLAIDRDVVVMDTSSLKNHFGSEALVAWPYDGMSSVPLRFVPEIPNPVPGEDQATFGYPFTLQAYWGLNAGARTLELEMFEGKRETPVDCHVITPEAPLFDRLAPSNAYCLIPKAGLSGRTGYRVVARCVETGRTYRWSFTTGGS